MGKPSTEGNGKFIKYTANSSSFYPFGFPDEGLWSFKKEKQNVSHKSRKIMQEKGENANPYFTVFSSVIFT